MFAFAFALVPLYYIFCEALGIGIPDTKAYEFVSAANAEAKAGRAVKMVFLANKSENMPWDFKVERNVMHVKLGDMNEINFHVTNPTDKKMIGQAIYYPLPTQYRDYIHKFECFCFEHQPLEAGETAEMKMQFMVSRDLPDNVESFKLSYELFDVTDMFN